MPLRYLFIPLTLLCTACVHNYVVPIEADLLIRSGMVYRGDNKPGKQDDVAICGEVICYIGDAVGRVKAKKVINAKGLVVTPGFIDPHTHSLSELMSTDKNSNLNYLTQGVTTVITGNDGDGSYLVESTRRKLQQNGIGTNVGLLVGHGAVRKAVMGLSDKPPSSVDLCAMKTLVEQAMQEGALGLSSGLYYVPGSYADTDEVIALAKVASSFGGIYESHIRDESTFNIGFLNAVKEIIEIAKKADISAHIAHIKALGVDVWGESQPAIRMINKARRQGLKITADQYPWQASGTFLHSAVIPPWVLADSKQATIERLKNTALLIKIKQEIAENIRRRGGASSLLVTASENKEWQGKNLRRINEKEGGNVEDTVIKMVLAEDVRVASFNMSIDDLLRFMVQPWVVSSSDGTDGHPRKYASFPKKYQDFVMNRAIMTFPQFVSQSSSVTADIFNLKKRGRLHISHFADINVIDLKQFKPKANFKYWNRLSSGVVHQLVNGKLVISDNKVMNVLAGHVL